MDLTIENSWWNTQGLWDDSDLKKVKSSLLAYYPTPILPEECQTPAIITLRGPRRAGKTVCLKLLIADLIDKQGWHPRSILWTSFETFRTLEQAESNLMNLIKLHSKEVPPRALFIDEATSLIGWQKVIKKLVDAGPLSELFIGVTGSSAYDLKKGAERMAGRRGTVTQPDRVLLPMSFEVFFEQIKSAVPSIEDAFQVFLLCGGFPFRVDEFLKSKNDWDPLRSMSVFDDVFFYELTKRKLDRNLAIEILHRLASVGVSAMSYEGFSKGTSSQKDSVKRHLDAFGDAFLLATLASYDTARNRVAPKKDKKWIWIDPALCLLSENTQQTERMDVASRAEMAVGSELIRRHEHRLFEGLSAPRNVFTWKSSSGKEVDFLVINRAKKMTLPVEVKYQAQISSSDWNVMDKSFHQGSLLTRSFEHPHDRIKIMPVHSFLLK